MSKVTLFSKDSSVQCSQSLGYLEQVCSSLRCFSLVVYQLLLRLTPALLFLFYLAAIAGMRGISEHDI